MAACQRRLAARNSCKSMDTAALCISSQAKRAACNPTRRLACATNSCKRSHCAWCSPCAPSHASTNCEMAIASASSFVCKAWATILANSAAAWRCRRVMERNHSGFLESRSTNSRNTCKRSRSGARCNDNNRCRASTWASEWKRDHASEYDSSKL